MTPPARVEPWVSQNRGPHQVISLQDVPGQSGLHSLLLTIWLRVVFDAILGGLSPKGSIFV